MESTGCCDTGCLRQFVERLLHRAGSLDLFLRDERCQRPWMDMARVRSLDECADLVAEQPVRTCLCSVINEFRDGTPGHSVLVVLV